MLRKIEPRLRRSNVVVNSFGSCISNAPEEFAWTPEMPFGEVFSQPRMLPHEFERGIALKQLQSLADRHSCGQLNKQVDMVNSNMEFVDFTPMFDSNFCDESLDINSDPIKLHGISGIFRFPHKVEGILPEGMFKTFQFHFFAPQTVARNKAHAKFVSLIQEGSFYPPNAYTLSELNFIGGGLSSSA